MKKLNPPTVEQIRAYAIVHEDCFSLVHFADWVVKTAQENDRKTKIRTKARSVSK